MGRQVRAPKRQQLRMTGQWLGPVMVAAAAGNGGRENCSGSRSSRSVSHGWHRQACLQVAGCGSRGAGCTWADPHQLDQDSSFGCLQLACSRRRVCVCVCGSTWQGHRQLLQQWMLTQSALPQLPRMSPAGRDPALWFVAGWPSLGEL